MAITPYAELSDLVERSPRELTTDEEDRAAILLGDASFWLGVWVPGLEAAVIGGNEKISEAAKLLVVAMVRRSLNSPLFDDGVASTTQVAGPFQNVVAYRNPDGNLYLYSRELDAIRGLLRGNSADAVSMTLPGL